VAVRFSVTIDCADPDRLTRFWATALGYELKKPPPGFDTWLAYFRDLGVPEDELRGATDVYLVDPAGVGPTIFFQEVPEPKTVKNRVHLDLNVSGGQRASLEERHRLVHTAADRLVAAGATRPPVPADWAAAYHPAVTLLDPEGNEFCIN
jgi:catechol 2,3-dioxygenase-like lactoylglutathione lyase family enzyme